MKTTFISIIVLLLPLLFFPAMLSGQIFKNGDKADLGLAIKVHLALGRRHASFYNLSFAAGVSKKLRPTDLSFSAMPGAQLTLNFYSRGIGTSVLDCSNRRGQLDIVSSFFVVGGYDDRAAQRQQYVRLFNQLSASTIWHDFEGAISYATSFIINTSGRNQQIGHLGFNIDQAIVLGYYNDGFWPFNKFAGDLYDRYWTGGGYVGVGFGSFGNKLSRKNPWMSEQFVEFAYDRFTGDIQTSYKLSKELMYTIIPQKDIKQAFFNRALTSLSLRNINGSNVGIGLIGQCPKCDIQDGLHRILGYSRHSSMSRCIFVPQGSIQFNHFYHLLNQNPQ